MLIAQREDVQMAVCFKDILDDILKERSQMSTTENIKWHQ